MTNPHDLDDFLADEAAKAAPPLSREEMIEMIVGLIPVGIMFFGLISCAILAVLGYDDMAAITGGIGLGAGAIISVMILGITQK